MQLNYKQFGQGHPIIILHGLFGSLDNWQTIARQLAQNYMVFVLDQRNHGYSPHVETFDYESMAEDLRLFMEDNWIYGATILGHSMGGKTAMQFALDNPDMVNRLVIVDIGPKAYRSGHQSIFEAMFSLDVTQLTNRKIAYAHFKKTIEKEGVRQFLLKNLTRNRAGSYAWKMNLPVIYQNYDKILAAIESDEVFDKPTLFIKGELSPYITEKDHSFIHTLFPNAEIKTVAGAGHWVHSEKPRLFLDVLNGFFNN